MLKNKILSAVGGNEEKIYSSDVFSTYLYTGNGATQTINNGIDLAGKGGLVWMKDRTNSGSGHQLFDTARGVPNYLGTDSTSAQYALGSFQSFNSNGFTVEGAYGNNTNGTSVVSWTFRKAPKFFDVVTYTGDGGTASARNINHNLGIVPGVIRVKSTSISDNWKVFHREPTLYYNNLYLNTSDSIATAGYLNAVVGGSSDTFSVYSSVQLGKAFGTGANDAGVQYVAHLFAHDPSADGIIQCGGFTTDASGNGSYNHGWAKGVQYIELKCATGSGDWEVYDSARSPAWSADQRLRPNLTAAEDTVTRVSASGTSLNFTGLSANQTYILMAIVAP